MSPEVLVWLLVERDGAFLLCRRKPGQPPFAGQWVLPGDRMRASESASETLSRVASKDLGVRLGSEEFVDTFFAGDDETEFALNVFRCDSLEGRPRYRQGGPYAEARWLRPSDLRKLGGTPAQLVDLVEGKRHWPQATAPSDVEKTKGQ